MGFIEIFLIAVGLSMDAFSVSLSAGCVIKKPDAGHYLRIAGAFGFFQFIMPIIGFFAGLTVEPYIKQFDHWIACILLSYIGGKMIHNFFSENENSFCKDPSRGKTLLVLAVTTSIDALAVGLSLGVMHKPIFIPAIIIGAVCAVFSAAGLAFGKKLESIIGKKMELIGGIILIGIGVKVLLEHIL